VKDVLSQNEIDTLIQALSTGEFNGQRSEDDDSQSHKYDFRRPNKFSKEQMRTLQIIHENYARITSNFLTAYLRTNIKIQLATVSQVTFEEFIFSLPTPTLMTIFSASESLGSAMLETNPQFTFPIIDLLFGGRGEMPKAVRELTEIEITVMRRVITKMLENLRYAWEDIYVLEPRIENIDTNPQFNQMLASTETVALMTFSTEIGEAKGLINICFPYVALEPVIMNLTAQHWFSLSQGEEKKIHKLLEKCLGPLEVNMTAVLGSTEIQINDFLEFEVGDVILLDQKINSPLVMFVEDKPMFEVQAGAYKGKRAVQFIGERGKGRE
jgi:flagellar motor switch protein FliM